MPITWRDRITPTAVGLVSRAWVIAEVERAADRAGITDAATRAQWVEVLVGYEPPRAHGIRNNAIVWIGLIGGAMLASAFGLPAWTGFVAALIGFLLIARELAVRALRWRLGQLLAERRA
ncbi:hypothetical protein FBR04_06025 [Betaproteobacteria bacterium PRO7]|jgi:hypothetical protein|nr:hypothetical protein [Betaproteobacteria bacterium PRO7]